MKATGLLTQSRWYVTEVTTKRTLANPKATIKDLELENKANEILNEVKPNELGDVTLLAAVVEDVITETKYFDRVVRRVRIHCVVAVDYGEEQ